jgi:disulfide bond formation protein DsbB
VTPRAALSSSTGCLAVGGASPPVTADVATPVLAVGLLVFTVGLAVSFAGDRVRARITGLAVMASGALLALVAADPTDAATWWLAGPAGITFGGMIWFAALLHRWAAAGSDGPPTLEEPG